MFKYIVQYNIVCTIEECLFEEENFIISWFGCRVGNLVYTYMYIYTHSLIQQPICIVWRGEGIVVPAPGPSRSSHGVEKCLQHLSGWGTYLHQKEAYMYIQMHTCSCT